MAVKLTSYKEKLRLKVTLVLALGFAIFLLILLSGHPKFIERYYSEGVYPIVCRILHPVFNLFPFSLGDVLYLLVIGYLVYALFKLIQLIVKKLFRQALMLLLGLTIGVETAILIFYLFWGMNYFRPSAGQRLNLRDTSYTTAQLKAVTATLIDSANATRARVTAADLLQANQTIFKTAITAVKKRSDSSINFRT